MSTRSHFGVGEWYHCYNRGIDKRKVFHSVAEYERFLSLMYLANATERLHASDYKNYLLAELLRKDIDRGESRVEIGAWCLMPNHVHLLLKEIQPGGIASFMQKVFTGYTMYFNKKHDRTGALFAGVFKSRHVADDRYLKHVVSYIHMNPIELSYSNWETGEVSVRSAIQALDRYRYSSLKSFEEKDHELRSILSESVFELFDALPKREKMLADAIEYFQENNNVKVSP